MRYLCVFLLSMVAFAACAADTPTQWPGVYWHTLEHHFPANLAWLTPGGPVATVDMRNCITLPALKDELVLKDGEGVVTFMKPRAPLVVAGPSKAPVSATPESVEVKDNKDGTATVTVTVAVKAVVGDTASVARQRALVTAAAACNDAAYAERMTDAEIEAQRAKDIAEANAKADRLKASRPKEK